jgi:hypothetical protein
MKKFLTIVKISALVLVLVSGAGLYIYMNGSYSEGDRAGRLIKLSSRGYIIKTWEGQLDVGGLSSGSGGQGLSSLWDFSVPNDKELLEKLKSAEGRLVRLQYEEKYVVLFWRGDTKYFIKSVEIIQ